MCRAATASASPSPSAERGYRKLFLQTVTQADKGVDFDFLRASVVREVIPGSK